MIADKNHLIVFQELIDKDLVSVDVQGRVGWYCFLNVIEWLYKLEAGAPWLWLAGCSWPGSLTAVCWRPEVPGVSSQSEAEAGPG